jgi:hypothetical protein
MKKRPQKKVVPSTSRMALALIVGVAAVLSFILIMQKANDTKTLNDIRNQAAGNKCDGWAEPGSTHCNTGSCQQFSCGTNGQWVGPQGTGVCGSHPSCSGQGGGGQGGGGSQNQASQPAANNGSTCESGGSTARVCYGVAVGAGCKGFDGRCVKNGGTNKDGFAVCGCVANNVAPTTAPTAVKAGTGITSGTKPTSSVTGGTTNVCGGRATGSYWCDGKTSKYCVDKTTKVNDYQCQTGYTCVSDSRRCITSSGATATPMPKSTTPVAVSGGSRTVPDGEVCNPVGQIIAAGYPSCLDCASGSYDWPAGLYTAPRCYVRPTATPRLAAGVPTPTPKVGDACSAPHGQQVYRNLYCCNINGSRFELVGTVCPNAIDTSDRTPLPDHTHCFFGYQAGISTGQGSCYNCTTRNVDGGPATYTFDSKTYCGTGRPTPAVAQRKSEGQSCNVDLDCNTNWCDNGMCKRIYSCRTGGGALAQAWAFISCDQCPNGYSWGGLLNAQSSCNPPIVR